MAASGERQRQAQVGLCRPRAQCLANARGQARRTAYPPWISGGSVPYHYANMVRLWRAAPKPKK
jgi:hypothetical protein